MKNDFQLNLGELLHIEFSDGRKCQAVAQLIRDQEIWTQQFMDSSSGGGRKRSGSSDHTRQTDMDA